MRLRSVVIPVAIAVAQPSPPRPQHQTGRTIEIEFDSVDLAGGHRDHGRTWFAHDAPGENFLEPMVATAGGTTLTRNSAFTQVLFGSELTADVTRTATEPTWAATATRWSGRTTASRSPRRAPWQPPTPGPSRAASDRRAPFLTVSLPARRR